MNDQSTFSDFNDLASSKGLQAVGAQLLKALSSNGPVVANVGASVATVDFAKENAERLEWERKIEATDDFEALVYELVPAIQAATIREATREKLLKLAARKAGISKQVLLEGSEHSGDVKGDGGGGKGGADYGEQIAKINASHAVIPIGGGVYIVNRSYDPMLDRPTLTFSTESAFCLRYRNKKVWHDGQEIGLGSFWLDHPDRAEYQGLVFSPDKEVPGYLNLWQGWGITPHEGDCSQWVRFVEEVICNGDEELFGYLICYLAHMVQKPRELPETAIVFRGDEGVGKNTFFEAVREIVGKAHYIMLSSIGQIAGRFSGHLADVLFVLCSEAVCSGDKTTQGILKEMITGDVIPIEKKGKDIDSVCNFKRVAFSSNEQWVVPRGADDRRYVIFDVSPKYKGDYEYWKGLRCEMDNGGVAALFYYLLQVDLSNWHPRMIPDRLKENGYEMKIKDLDSIDAWWLSVLQRGWLQRDDRSFSESSNFLWPEWIFTETIQNDYVRWCNDYKKLPEHSVVVGKSLRKYGLSSCKPRVGNPDRKPCYKIPELDKARAICSSRFSFPSDVFGSEDDDGDD